MKIAGVYKIECIKNNMVYVGASVDIKTRVYHHFRNLKNGIHGNLLMQENFNLHGIENFKWEMLERCTPSKLKEREIEWISKLDAVIENKGFNIIIPFKESQKIKDNKRNYPKAKSNRKFRILY